MLRHPRESLDAPGPPQPTGPGLDGWDPPVPSPFQDPAARLPRAESLPIDSQSVQAWQQRIYCNQKEKYTPKSKTQPNANISCCLIRLANLHLRLGGLITPWIRLLCSVRIEGASRQKKVRESLGFLAILLRLGVL